MYNLFQATKLKKQLKKQRLKNQKQQQWLNKYKQQTKPKLLQAYNKRINYFIRRIQQKPIILKQFIEYQPNKVFRQLNKQGILANQNFKFKDKNDWNSIYPELQRKQKLKNQIIMQKIFGDKSLAYRSIISQSQYTSAIKHQFRERLQQKQINPPMKYTFLPPKIMIKKYDKNKKLLKVKTQGYQNQKHLEKNTTNCNENLKNHSFCTKDNPLLSEQDTKSYQSMKTLQSVTESLNSTKSKFSRVNNTQNQEQKQRKQSKKYFSRKLHFKTLIETYQMTEDTKIKQEIKQLLIKCGVFRNKQKKKMNNEEQDGLSSLDNVQTYNVTIIK